MSKPSSGGALGAASGRANAVDRSFTYPGQSLDPIISVRRWIVSTQGQEAKTTSLLIGRLRAAAGEGGKGLDRGYRRRR